MNESAEAEPIYHPSIGGKEQEPKIRDVPLELVDAVLDEYGSDPFIQEILSCVPPGWMKTEQRWVQMEMVYLIDNVEVPYGIYRVKQPSEDHPAG